MRSTFCPSYSALMAVICFAMSCGNKALGSERDELIKAWESRRSRVSSLDFAWSGVETQAGTEVLPVAGAKAVFRPKVSFAYRAKFVVDSQGRVFLDHHGKRWSNERAEYVDSRTITVFDGRVRTDYFPSGEKFPSAHITEEDASATGRHLYTLAIRLALCPLDARLAVFDRAKLVSSGQVGQVGEVRCAIFKHGEDRVWVDPAREYIPLRWYENRGGVTSGFIEIEYAQRDESGWLPVGWKYVALNPKGDVVDSTTAKVTQSQINGAVLDEQFRLEYPPGTWVRNYVNNERYIVRESGAKRPVRDGEYDGTNYETILRTEPPGWSFRFWASAISALAVAALAAKFVWRFRRRLFGSKHES